MKKINLTIKNHFKDVIQKEKRQKLIKSFLFNIKQTLIITKNLNMKKQIIMILFQVNLY